MCQDGCNIKEYKSSNKKAVCECSIEEEKEDELNKDEINLKFNNKNFGESFLTTLKNSNFLVLKCFKLVFNIHNLCKNIGMIFMSIILFLSISLIFIYYFKGQKKIKFYIQSIINQKIYDNNKKSNISKKENKTPWTEQSNQNLRTITKNNKKNKKRHIKGKKKNLSKNKGKKSNFPPKKPKNARKNILSTNNRLSSCNWIYSNSKLIEKNSRLSFDRKSYSNTNNLLIKRKNKTKKNKIENTFSFLDISKKDSNKTLTENELNILEYELALETDKRTYLQYYWSLLKKKQLILFTFFPVEDYNLTSIKISLFLMSFSLSFTINGFFFTDETMHNVYENKGVFDFIYQIQQILYSTIICAVINVILKQLSLSEKNILEIKQQKNYKKLCNESKKIEKCINIKFNIFFIVSVLLLLFFWYFISCFCIVYNNTQLILIEDTLISFGLSMIYPFGLNLLPGLFRIPALKAKDKNKKCIYKFSLLIALI